MTDIGTKRAIRLTTPDNARISRTPPMITPLAMAWAGLEAGIRRFDAAFGGLGGCPFAPGAAGNLATEDLVFMLSEAGIETGIDWRRLFDAVALAETLLDRPLGGRMAAWWRQAQAKEVQAKEAARREMPA